MTEQMVVREKHFNVSRHVKPSLLTKWKKKYWVWRMTKEVREGNKMIESLRSSEYRSILEQCINADARNNELAEAVTLEDAAEMAARIEIEEKAC